MNVLFVMHYPGYLRYYDGVVRELAARGHHVTLRFDEPGKQAEGLRALDDRPAGVTIAGALGGRRDFWEPVATELRRTTDYVRYLHPRFAQADYLRRRLEHLLAGVARGLTRLPTQPARRVERALKALLALEHAIPSSRRMERVVAEARPDVVVVTPLVTDASRQTDVVKAAHALGIPAVLAVGSWDHLTTKGMIRERVDRVLVWNELQRDEATELHFIAPETIEVTGAQPFDRWFARRPSGTREAFAARVGLPAEKPFVLFVGSTASISAPAAEVDFVRRWIAALRRSGLDDVGVLVRPHPYNVSAWRDADLSDLDAVAVYPRAGANPVDEDDRADYYDSLYHAEAVVGINTSAMVEAAIVGRPVLTIESEDFTATQSGTVHFGYLTRNGGGPVAVAHDLQEHAAMLGATLADGEAARAAGRAFLGSFVRPHGLERPATPLVADAIERAASAVPAPPPGPRARAAAPLIWLSVALLTATSPTRLRGLAKRLLPPWGG
ncbi:hypothetical protein [Solirubrobacter soli]|uniref:hypothetical protein n=1 Tax=Solirubrobacter soli TaxID=363832 RepID=UPI00041E35CD|nr:hypothetical protein [Solirubrobacter soli]